jgi:hypothetical protein
MSWPVEPSDARTRILEAIGAGAVARRAIGLYREVVEAATPARAARRAAPLPTNAGHGQAPRLLLATGRDQAWELVSALPEALRRTGTLVVPAARPDTQEDPIVRPDINLVEALPIPHPTRPPSGRSPITRLRRLLYRPAPTGRELLHRALQAAARRIGQRGSPVEAVALDAPAAVLIAESEEDGLALAPGSLRWLADRWDAESGPANATERR